MATSTRKKKHQRLEAYLTKHFLFRTNEITGSIEFRRHVDGSTREELNKFNIYRHLRLEGFNVNLNELIYLLKSDIVNKYNPILSYFTSLPVWSAGMPDYNGQLCSYVKVWQADRFELHFTKWMVLIITCVLEEQYCNKNAIILVHKQQNSSKITFICFLCPLALKQYITENISFDKDSLIPLVENFLINLDELGTFSRVEINAIRSVLSKSFVKERHPFELKAKKLPRRLPSSVPPA